MREDNHEALVKGITKQLKAIMDKSPQAIYIYLDDTHKACNKKFADLLGYTSAEEWANIEAPLANVIEEDQQKMIAAYKDASEKMAASSFHANFTNVQTRKNIKTNVIMVPIAYDDEIFAMHFVTGI